MKYKAEVKVDDEWCSNALKFNTRREAEEYAKKQMELSLVLKEPAQRELSLGQDYEREKEKNPYERRPKKVPVDFDLISEDFVLTFKSVKTVGNKVIVAAHMSFHVQLDATEEVYGAIKAFVSYLDDNKDNIVDALATIISRVHEEVRLGAIEWHKTEIERNSDKVDAGQHLPPVPTQPMEEAVELSTVRLYQVVLVLRVNKPIRDIAGKLNRIRAIEGVTVVCHEVDEDVLHRGDIVAKVKFHIKKDSTTPSTYVNQVLVPQINDSLVVPEVKVLNVVRGTLKKI
jgi:hypothetical protein